MAKITSRTILVPASTTGHSISLCMETRQQFSITLEGDESGWGEFFSKEEAALLYLWLGERLHQIVS